MSPIVRLFVGGVAAFIVGLCLAQGSIVLGAASGVYIIDPGEIVGVRMAPLGFLVAAMAAVAAIALVGGVLAAVSALILGLVAGSGRGPSRI